MVCGCILKPFGLRLSKLDLTVVTPCLCSGRRPGVARRASNFLSRRRKKVTKERATPLSASPALCAGATCGARAWGALRNSLRACGAPLKQPQRVSPRSVCPSAHAAPRPALLGAYRGDGERTSIRAIASLGPSRGRKRLALVTAAGAGRDPCQVERSDDPCGCSAVRCPSPSGCACAHELGPSEAKARMDVRSPSPLYAPRSAGRGVACAEGHTLRGLTRCGCLSGAPRARSEFRSAPHARAPQVARSEAQGTQTAGSPFLW